MKNLSIGKSSYFSMKTLGTHRIGPEVLFRLIAETNNMGIWKRDLGNQLNIDKKELTKRLSSMEKRKLIKKISSNVDGNMKIRFILFGIEPDSSITGGAFVDGDRFDKELVEVRLPRILSIFQKIGWIPSITSVFRIVHIC